MFHTFVRFDLQYKRSLCKYIILETNSFPYYLCFSTITNDPIPLPLTLSSSRFLFNLHNYNKGNLINLK